MKNLKVRINSKKWEIINKELIEKGYVIIDNLLTDNECKALIELWSNDDLYRTTVNMNRYNFGRGTYRYFKYPLPDVIQLLRKELYENIVCSANIWSERLRFETKYPKHFSNFVEQMQKLGQTKPTPLILRYKEDDFNCLHQDINNDLVFPYQVVLGLSKHGKDYDGGQFILTQQRPRMQTIPHVIMIPKGGAVIFTSNFHPQLGARGFYRSVFKHGVGKVDNGDRYTIGIVFHDFRA